MEASLSEAAPLLEVLLYYAWTMVICSTFSSAVLSSSFPSLFVSWEEIFIVTMSA